MRFAASVFDTLSSLISPPNYVPVMPQSEYPDNDDDIELRLLTASDSPRASDRQGPRSRPGTRAASALQVLSLAPDFKTVKLLTFVQWLKRCMPSALVKRQECGPRRIVIGNPNSSFARNVTRNQKYSRHHAPPCCCCCNDASCVALSQYQT